jgi:hypothetical protein
LQYAVSDTFSNVRRQPEIVAKTDKIILTRKWQTDRESQRTGHAPLAISAVPALGFRLRHGWPVGQL